MIRLLYNSKCKAHTNELMTTTHINRDHLKEFSQQQAKKNPNRSINNNEKIDLPKLIIDYQNKSNRGVITSKIK